MLFSLLPAGALAEDALPEKELLLEEELELLPEPELIPEDPPEEPEEIPALPEDLPEELLLEELEEISAFLDDVPDYAVTLLPEKGSENAVVLRHTDTGRWADSRESAQNGQFFAGKNGELWFKFPDCPFSAPEGKSFEKWGLGAPGEVMQLIGNLTLTAQWRTAANSPINNIPPAAGISFWLHDIQWRVIGKSDTAWLVILDNLGIIDTMTWADALNYCDTFYDSFTGPEKAAVIPTTKTDRDFEDYTAADLNNAALFLLSAEEAVTYFPSAADRDSGWWLRSRNRVGSKYVGYILDGSLFHMRNNYYGLTRPAFQMDPKAILFTSAAKGGKSSAAAAVLLGLLMRIMLAGAS